MEQPKRRRRRRGVMAMMTETPPSRLSLLLLLLLATASGPADAAGRRDRRHRSSRDDGAASLPTATTTFFARTFDSAAAATARLDEALKAATQQLAASSPSPVPGPADGAPLPPPLPMAGPGNEEDASSSSSSSGARQSIAPQQLRCLTALAFVSSDAGADALPSCPPPSDPALSFVEARYQNLRQESGRAPGGTVGGPPARLTACLAFSKGGCPPASGPFLADVALAAPGGCGSLGGGGGGGDPWQFGGPLWPGPGAPGLCVRRTRDPARSLSDVRVAYVRVYGAAAAAGGGGGGGGVDEQQQATMMQRRDQDRREACPRGFRPAPGGVLSGGGSSASNGGNRAGVLEAFFCAAGQPQQGGGASFRPPPGSLVPERGLLSLPSGPPLAALATAAALLGLKTDARLLIAAHSDGGADLAAPGLSGGRGGGGCLSLPTGGKGGAAAQRLSLIGDGLRVVAAAACGALGLSEEGDAWSDAYAHQHWQLQRMNEQQQGGGGASVWRVKSRLTGECLTGAGDALLVAQQPCGNTASGAPLPWQLWALDFAGAAAPAPYWTLRSLAPPINAKAAAASRQPGGGATAPLAVLSAAAAAAATPPSSSSSPATSGPAPLCASVYHDVDDYYDLGDPGQKPPEDRGLDPGAAPTAFAPALVLRPCAPAKDARQRFSVLASATAFTSAVPGGVVLGAALGARDGGGGGSGRPAPAPAPALSLNATDDPLTDLVEGLLQFGAALINKNKTGSSRGSGGDSNRSPRAGTASRPPPPPRSPSSSSSSPRQAPSPSRSSGGGSGRGRTRSQGGGGGAPPAPQRQQTPPPSPTRAPPPPPPPQQQQRPPAPQRQQPQQQRPPVQRPPPPQQLQRPPPPRPPPQQQRPPPPPPQQQQQQQQQRPPSQLQRATGGTGGSSRTSPSPSRRHQSSGGGGRRDRD